MYVQWPVRRREPENQATRSELVFGIGFDKFARRDGIANLLYGNVPNDALICRMLGIFEATIPDLLSYLGNDVYFTTNSHAQRLRTFPRPRCSRIAVRFDLAPSSAKALSRKTMVVSPGGRHLFEPIRDTVAEDLNVSFV